VLITCVGEEPNVQTHQSSPIISLNPTLK